MEELKGKILQNFDHFNLDKYATQLGSIIYENITGAGSSNDALSRWLASQPHTDTLKKDIEYSCIATGSDYAVQIFSSME